MKPLIDIHRADTDTFAYQVSASGADAQEGGSAFESLERCLFDAGVVLGQYFMHVEVNFQGMFFGECATDALRRDPKTIADRIAQRCQPA